jgi:hypothetical protein
LEAIDIFTQESVNPVTTTLLAMTPRETVFVGLYYRSLGLCRTAKELKSVVHQQSLTSAERSMVELYIDMELLARNVVPAAIEKFIAFMDWQRLRAARRADAFFLKNPDLDTIPSKAEPHRQLINTRGPQIEATVLKLWGLTSKNKPVKPEHWSSWNLVERAEKIDQATELLVLEGYDMRNFSVHTGLAGIADMPLAAFEIMCAQSLNTLGECMLGELSILGREIPLPSGVPDYWAKLDALKEIQTYAFADKLLQLVGEPPRYFIHPGMPTPQDRASRRFTVI